MDCSPPGSSVHGDSLGKNTGVGSLSLLQGIFHPRDWTQVSHIASRFFTNWAIREAHIVWCLILLSSWHSWEHWCTHVRDIELVVYFAWISLWLTLSVSLRICSHFIFSMKPSLTCLFKTVSPSPLYAQPSSMLYFSLLNLLPYDKIYILCGCHQSRNFFPIAAVSQHLWHVLAHYIFCTIQYTIYTVHSYTNESS